jgi:hypothetical protein
MLPIVARNELPDNAWRAAYFDNPDLLAPPLYYAEEARVDFDWGEGAPGGLPADNFSVEWTGNWHFEVGRYTFFLFADDGVRLWLDGELILDAWGEGPGLHRVTSLLTTDGMHRVTLQYFEGAGSAAVRLHWRRTDLYPYWQGDYYQEPWVEGGWAYSGTDDAIQFDWGVGCPACLPCDYFSVSWRASPLLKPGTNRIFVYADEGYQLYVDDQKVMEGGWYDGQGGGSEDVSYDLEAAGLESHAITFNFHDRGGPAEARIWLEYVEEPRWQAEYFDSVEPGGTPELVKNEAAIFYDWGYEKPRPKMPSDDRFSVRWTGQRYFHSGFYRFGLFADDGVRLWIDGELLVDEWHVGRAEYHSQATYLMAGYHEVVIEYFEDTGLAEIRFWWE